MTTSVENMQPLIERWMLARGWRAGARSHMGVLWHHGRAQVIVPDEIEAASVAWRSVVPRLAAACSCSVMQVTAEIDRATAHQLALDAWHDFQQWVAQVPDEMAAPLAYEALAYMEQWLAEHPAAPIAEPGNPGEGYDADRDEPW
jgi:hypothetical protein